MAAVEIRDVWKSFGTTDVIRGVSIDIADGEFVVLVGPSGCGKSTLLRTIAGLEAVTRGEIIINGRNVTDLPPKRRDVAMVFQNYALYPHMTVARNMGFPLEVLRAPKAVLTEHVKRAADILGLEALLDRYPRQLSGGQRQRVAMGRAVVRAPQVFLFDEPLSNLDAKLRVQMRAEIRSLHRRLGATMIYVTHDQIEAMTMADRIVVMNGGVIEQTGAPLEVFDRPTNLFVSTFIGSPAMNLIEGQIERRDGAPLFRSKRGLRLPLPTTLPSSFDGRSVIFGIRPEHLTIADEGAPAEILFIEPIGADIVVSCRWGSEEVLANFRNRSRFREGQRIRLRLDPAMIHLFEGHSGHRVQLG
jgi:multiple sugar transport system ATP-binding protein